MADMVERLRVARAKMWLPDGSMLQGRFVAEDGEARLVDRRNGTVLWSAPFGGAAVVRPAKEWSVPFDGGTVTVQKACGCAG